MFLLGICGICLVVLSTCICLCYLNVPGFDNWTSQLTFLCSEWWLSKLSHVRIMWSYDSVSVNRYLIWFMVSVSLPLPSLALNIRIIAIELLVKVEEFSLAFTWQYCEFLERVVIRTQIERWKIYLTANKNFGSLVSVKQILGYRQLPLLEYPPYFLI